MKRSATVTVGLVAALAAFITTACGDGEPEQQGSRRVCVDRSQKVVEDNECASTNNNGGGASYAGNGGGSNAFLWYYLLMRPGTNVVHYPVGSAMSGGSYTPYAGASSMLSGRTPTAAAVSSFRSSSSTHVGGGVGGGGFRSAGFGSTAHGFGGGIGG